MAERATASLWVVGSIPARKKYSVSGLAVRVRVFSVCKGIHDTGIIPNVEQQKKIYGVEKLRRSQGFKVKRPLPRLVCGWVTILARSLRVLKSTLSR